MGKSKKVSMRNLWVFIVFITAIFANSLQINTALAVELSAAEIATKVEEVLNAESLQDGWSGTAKYPSANLNPSQSLNFSISNENKMKEVNKALALEFSSSLSGLEKESAQKACLSTRGFILKGMPLGAISGPSDRDSDEKYFKENSATRTCWENRTPQNERKMVAELRQVMFIPKNSVGDLQNVFKVVTSFERSPNTTGDTHNYEYLNPLAPTTSNLNIHTKGDVLDPMELNKNYLIKKCVNVFGKNYCNTILNRAYKIADNAYFLTAEIYDLSKGDALITKDALGDSSSDRIAQLHSNSSDKYTSAYVIASLRNTIVIYSIGIQYRNDSCPPLASFLRSGHLKEFLELKNSIESETGLDVKTCPQL